MHKVKEFGGEGGRPFGSRYLSNLEGEVAQSIRDWMILKVGVTEEKVWETGGDGEGGVRVPGEAAEAGVKG